MRNIKNPKMLAELKAKIDEHEVISFDIFDTLLLRAYAKPDDVFRHLGMLNDDEDFATKRCYADGVARLRNPQREEITFDQIYDFLGKRYEDLKQQELDMEESVLTANPEMLEVFNYAKEQGKKIVILSDMYLSKDFLEMVLQKKGYSGFNKLYVSADINKTKRSGSLYKHVLDELEVSPGKMIHIGDNLSVDCEVANYLGISTFYYEKVMNRFFQQNPKATIFHQNNSDNIAVSIILGVSAIKSLTSEDNYWENLGYDYAGPIAYGYTEWLYKEFKKDGIEEALFVARDGYILDKIFRLFKDNDIKSHYFLAPRSLYQAIKLSTDHHLNLEVDKLNAMKSLLNYYKNKHLYLQSNTPDITTSAEGASFIQSNYKLYEQLATMEFIEYLNYIKSKNIGSGNVALVDGQSYSLTSQKLVTMFMPNNTIHGYYWKYLKETTYEHPEFYCKSFERVITPKKDWGFMEFILSAPEPPIVGVSNLKPIHVKELNEFDEVRIEKLALILDGALKFANDIQKHFRGNFTFMDDLIISDLISVLSEYPNPEDIKNLFEIKLDVSYYVGEKPPLFFNWPSPKV